MSSRSPPSTGRKKQKQRARLARNQAKAEKERREAQSRLEADLRDEQDQIQLRRALKLSRRAFQPDAMNATFGNATVVGAAIPQNVDDFGTEAGIDLTQVGVQSSGTQTSPSIVQVQGARAALRGALQGPSIGGDDTTVLANQIRSPAVNRTLDFNQSAIAGTPGTPLQNLDDFTLRDITPPSGATAEGFSPGIQALAGFVRQAGIELDNTNVPMGAADVHGAALDAVGSVDAGVLAARGGDRDPVPHMDDYGTALLEIKQLLQVLAGPQLAADSEPLESSDGPRQASAVPRAENDGDIWGRLARQSAAEDAQDADPTGILRPSNVVGDLETDESDSDEDDFGDMPSTPPAARDLRELLDAPPSADAPPGAAATSTTRKLDLVARAEAADALRRTPGIMKLIEARIFKFDDFLTDGSLDATKLAKVRRVLARRVDDTAESYALAASARGYAPSGAAYPIEGLNNIVAGVRKIPGSKYVMYQGPQYVNG
jgi:hypothetical protein